MSAEQVLLALSVLCFAIGALIGPNGAPNTVGLAGRLNWISAGLAFAVASLLIR